MKKLNIIGCLLLIILSGFVSANNYQEHKQNTNFTLSITSNNATSCNLSNIDYSNGINIIYNRELTQDGRMFYTTLTEGNYSNLGDVCHNIICTDGTNYETGSVCRTIKNSNLTFFIILLSLASLFFIATLFVNEEFFVYISGVLFLIAGVYTMINGIDIINNWYSRAISYVCIGLGFIFTIGAYLYNSYSKYHGEEYD